MRLDHIAFRVRDRYAAAQVYLKAPFHYKIQAEFEIPELCTKCLALVPPEKLTPNTLFTYSVPTVLFQPVSKENQDLMPIREDQMFHLAPEIFISSSEDPKSPVGQWVEARQGGGVHHLAYNVENVAEMMAKLKVESGWEFTTEEPIVDEELVQAFTKPSPVLGNVIIELINRPSSRGFSVKNVKDLMKSTDGLK